MNTAMNNIWVRIMAMMMTPVLGLLPAWLLGYTVWTNPPGDLWVDTGGIVTMGLSGAGLTALIWAIWGVKPPEWALDANLWKVISGQALRLLSYSQSALVAALPVSLVGLVELPARGGVLFHFGALPALLGVGAALTGGIFAAWGWKTKPPAA